MTTEQATKLLQWFHDLARIRMPTTEQAKMKVNVGNKIIKEMTKA